MFGNPYYGNFRENIPQQPQQPIQNIINAQMPLNDLFMAQYLKENEKVEEMFVNHKTAFIDLKNKELKIKEVNGNITIFQLIPPKDEKDIKIEELENKINELKGMITNEQRNDDATTIDESTKQDSNGGKYDKTKSTIK